MARYIGKKTLNAILILIVATVCIFAMVKASGLDPVLATQKGGQISGEVLQAKMERYGLNRPLPLQYLYWLKNVIVGNLGESVKYKVPVASLLSESLPVTLGLVFASFLVSQLTAIILGVVAAVHRGKILDRLISVLTVLFFSVPVFFLGLLAIVALSKYFPGYSYTGSTEGILQYFQRIAVPVVVIATHEIALVTQITRSAMIKQLSSDYVLALRARGIPERVIIRKHALKNSLIPIITVAGIQFGALIVGGVMVENLFSLNGIGRLMVQCVTVGDVAVVQGIALIIIIAFLIANLAVDTLYAVIDPRVRIQEGAANE